MDTPCSTLGALDGTPTHALAPNGAEKVWVGIRIRPLLRHEQAETAVWRASSDTQLTCLCDDKKQSSYQYDRVFGEQCSSEEVYMASAQDMVLSAMAGYNCTLFAYGQTGSGKTTTMRSVMQRAATDIFAHIARAPGREFVLRMCAIEVYNEVVHDLFADHDTNLNIRDGEKGPVVVDLLEQNIESEEHLLKMLKAVESRRLVRETMMNQASSRSHMVVRLYVESRPASKEASDSGDDEFYDVSSDDGGSSCRASGTGTRRPSFSGSRLPVVSTINFVDLAGSERLSQNSAGDDADKEKLRQKETGNINKSLLILGKVIRARGKTNEHAPYRDSKLTRILQPSISGNSRMAIICTLSPASGSVDNSRAALHFANHAKVITMRPQVNEVRDEQALIRKMEAEIQELRKKLGRIDRPERGSRHEAKLLAEKDAELRAKEEQMRKAMEDRATLQKRLKQLEGFIIRGGSPAPGMRRSFDGADVLSSLAADGPQSNGGHGHPHGGRGPSGLSGGGGVGGMPSVRASWNPGSSAGLGNQWGSASGVGKVAKAAMGRSVAPPGRLLLDYLLPPGVREAVNRLGGEHGPARVGGPGVAGSAAQVAAVAEISKLRAPEGHRAQEALSALQAEVRCYTQQPDAAAVVAAAAGATPDTADQLLQQLTQMLAGMETRHQSTMGAGGAVEHSFGAAAAAAQGDAAAAGGTPGKRPLAPTDGSGSTPQQARPAAGSAAEDEVNLIELLRKEVGRLRRLQEANAKAEQAISSLLHKVSAVGGPEVDGFQLPDVLHRLHTALQEADDLEPEAAGPAAADGTPVSRDRGGAEPCNNVPGTAAQDAPMSTTPAAAAARAIATAGGAAHASLIASSPARLTGNKLPRDVADEVQGAAGGAAVSNALKSPRRSLLASPRGVAGASPEPQRAGGSGSTPNSRIPRAAGMAASVGGVHALLPASGTPPVGQAAPGRQSNDSPRASGMERRSDDMALRRMPTPSLSMQASDGEPMSGGIGGGLRTGSASSRGGLLRWDTERAKRIISREKDAIHAWYATELGRLKSAFRQQAQADVEGARDAVEHYKGLWEETQERIERLNLQKQLLIKQVLQLELALEEAETQEAQSQALISQLTVERDQARFEATQARMQAKAAQIQAATATANANQQHLHVAPPAPDARAAPAEPLDLFDKDSWGDAPSRESLLPLICDLWDKLYMPLVYRSRFFVHFRHQETIYLEMEHRRLEWRYSKIRQEQEADYLGRSKQKDKLKRALDLERRVLAQSLRSAFSAGEREDLYAEWGVRPSSKNRKLQLVKKLWEPATTEDTAGMDRNAQLVLSLVGTDASEQFVQLFFGNAAEATTRPTALGAAVSTILNRVMTTPRGRRPGAPSPSTGGGPSVSTATTTTAMPMGTSPNGPPGAGGVTPRRQSSGLLAGLQSRLGSFMSRDGAAGGGAARASTASKPAPSPLGQNSNAYGAAHGGPSTPPGQGTGAGQAGTPGGGTPPVVPMLNLTLFGGGAGPLSRGLAAGAANSAASTPRASARGPAPPLPPQHPGTATVLAAGTPPSASFRGPRQGGGVWA